MKKRSSSNKQITRKETVSRSGINETRPPPLAKTTVATSNCAITVHNPQSATFMFTNEDYTLGNALRAAILSRPECNVSGYSIPHPLENKLRVHVEINAEYAAESDSLTEGHAAQRVVVGALDSLADYFGSAGEAFLAACPGGGADAGNVASAASAYDDVDL